MAPELPKDPFCFHPSSRALLLPLHFAGDVVLRTHVRCNQGPLLCLAPSTEGAETYAICRDREDCEEDRRNTPTAAGGLPGGARVSETYRSASNVCLNLVCSRGSGQMCSAMCWGWASSARNGPRTFRELSTPSEQGRKGAVGRPAGSRVTTKAEDKEILKTLKKVRPPGHGTSARRVHAKLPRGLKKKRGEDGDPPLGRSGDDGTEEDQQVGADS